MRIFSIIRRSDGIRIPQLPAGTAARGRGEAGGRSGRRRRRRRRATTPPTAAVNVGEQKPDNFSRRVPGPEDSGAFTLIDRIERRAALIRAGCGRTQSDGM